MEEIPPESNAPDEAAADPSPAFSLEEIAPLFPAYEFVGFIAEGGMGAVYMANQKSLDRPVAIKILKRELGEDPEFRESFEAEAKAMARLNHPNLIGVYDFGEANGMLFIIMEMVNGKSLHHSAYGRTIDPVQAGTLVAAISRGLAHAHSHGILHRDIKPGNILLDAKANPKIGDFGLAQPMGQKTGEDEQIYGTPGYTAPEVYHRHGDHRADIFSVGILLHELLTGSLPDDSGTPPSRICGCPRAFDEIFARATNPNPQMRYNSAEELASALDKAIESREAGNNASTNRLVLPQPGAAPAVKPTVAVVRPAAGATAQVSNPAATAARAQIQAQAQKQSPALVIGIIAGVMALIGIAVLAGNGGGGDKEKSKKQNGAEVSEAEKEKEKKRRQRKAREREEELERQRQARAREKERNKRPDKRDKPDKNPVAVTKKESPLAALAKLKAALASGGRAEFPPGTEARGGSHFVVVDQPMAWADANEFAEAHGAHLAILSSEADRKWLREKFPGDDPVWIGAGMAARDVWQWLDGGKVDGATAVDSTQRYLALGSGGEFRPQQKGENLHAVLQWRGDGSNPATAVEQLKRAAQTKGSGGLAKAILPVGTRSYDAENSHFFILPKALGWEEARKLALASGGYLAVPSSKAESAWMESTFADSKLPVWIGGFRLKAGEPWRWLSREAWNYSGGWSGGAAPISTEPGRLMLDAGGWSANDGADGRALGMMIEWSPEKQAATIAAFDLDAWLGKTDQTYSGRVQKIIDEYEKDREAIIDRYVRNIKRLGRKYESAFSGQDRKDDIKEAVRGAVRKVEKTGELLDDVPDAAPDDFHDLQKKSVESLEELDKEFDEKVGAELATYTQGLTKQSAQLAANGFDEDAAALKERVDSINGEVLGFVETLELEDPTGRAAAAAAAAEAAEDDDDDDE